jgi:hypothetical protein
MALRADPEPLWQRPFGRRRFSWSSLAKAVLDSLYRRPDDSAYRSASPGFAPIPGADSRRRRRLDLVEELLLC